MKIFNIIFCSLLSYVFLNPIFACTDFKLTAKDGSQIIARTMEFSLDLKSDLVTRPRGYSFKTDAPGGKPGMNWESKYGYLYVNALNKYFTVDGMNEQGLAFEYLYLPGETKYQTVPEGKFSQALPYYNFGDWVLGNFKTVAEVREAIKDVYVFEQKINGLGSMVFPLHAAIHDRTGNSIVVEFINGEAVIYDYIGVMTNDPNYNWQISNLRQYLNLTPYNPNPIVIGGVSYGSNGEGSGMLGLPGDISPPSRFVKMATMVKTALPVKDGPAAVNLAEHIINNVDIPAGFVRSKTNGKVSYETTQWSVFKDITNNKLFYHTYDNLSLRMIDLNKIDFSKTSKPRIIHMKAKPEIKDETSNMIELPNLA